MDGLQKLGNTLSKRREKNKRYLHSPGHVLADELAGKLHDKSHFGYYLKMATTHDHQILRKVLGQVLEAKEVKSPGKLFSYLLKRYDSETIK